MNAASVITIAISFTMCVIGILTFVSGRMSKAEQEGRLAEKLDTCCRGIDEIKAKLASQEHTQNKQNIALEQHEQRIRILENQIGLIGRRGSDGK